MEQISGDYLRKQMAEEIEIQSEYGNKREITALICFCITCDGLRDFFEAYVKGTLKSLCEKIKEEI